jgi:hypothetical protein
MKSINYRVINYIGIGVVICCFFACSKMNSTYKDFVKDGAVVYPGKADSLKAYPGRGRLGLSWTLADPKVSDCKIYWNQGKDSIDVPVQKITDIDTIRVTINNLQEGVYTFQVYSYDKDGHVSVAAEVIGTVYGDRYSDLLVNRFIKGMAVVDGKLVPDWSIPDDGTIGEQISYTDRNGDPRQIFMPVDDSAAGIDNIKPGSTFKYRTLYLPDPLAIDTFYSPNQTISVDAHLFDVELDKSKFSLYTLPGDYSTPNGSANTVDNIWTNGDAIQDGSTYISKVNGHALPQWFTIDLGGEYELSKMKLFQRGNNSSSAVRLYAGGNVREFEVWGSLNPDPDYNPDAHGGNFGSSWVLLQSCIVNRPSGNTLPAKSTRTDNTDEDIAAAEAGHEFHFNDVGKVRYVRIKVLSNWDYAGRAYVNICAIAFWTQ